MTLPVSSTFAQLFSSFDLEQLYHTPSSLGYAGTVADVDVGELARQAARSLGVLATRPAAWKPQPHQVPPPGDWYGWLLNAGRGSGKTDAVAHYVCEHVKGPPCLPGSTPHWIGIIAPTLGDAVTACYAGPSGIRAHAPDAKLRQSAGGTVIQWANGSEAKLFGASNPEDVERLRAGGNRCVRGNILVRTEHGEIPIKDVRVGDLVWTRNGLRRVLQAGQTGVRSLWRLETHRGRILDLTSDHKIWSANRWRELRFLEPGDTLDSWDHLSSTTEFDGISVKMDTTQTQREDVDYSTGLSGSRSTARFHAATTSITATTIVLTTSSATLNYSRPVNTRDSIPAVTCQCQMHAQAERRGQVGRIEKCNARCVAMSTRHAECEVARPARRFAALSRWPDVNSGLHERSLSGCAYCAVVSSTPRDEVRPRRVHDSVRRISRLELVEPVYDLQVEHDHEFFAGDILVANCLSWLEELAAWRYLQACWEQMRFGLRVGPRPHWVASTTPKPRPLIKKLVKETPANVVITTASTRDNPHLPQEVRTALDEEYGGTQLGRQELDAELLEEDRDALWRRETLERFRLVVPPSELSKVTVGVDPSGGAGEQGIVVVGRGTLTDPDLPGGAALKPGERPPQHGFVLDDRTCCLSPHGWGRRAVQAALDWDADDIVVERNYGGDMAVATIQDACDALNAVIPIRTVNASRGKRVRAEPVSALSERGRWHLVGTFPELEDQLCTWTPESDYSPDRLDAMVWPAWHLKLATTRTRGVGRLPFAEFAGTKLTD